MLIAEKGNIDGQERPLNDYPMKTHPLYGRWGVILIEDLINFTLIYFTQRRSQRPAAIDFITLIRVILSQNIDI